MGAQLDDPNREAVGLAPIWSTGVARKKAAPKVDEAEPEPKVEHKAEPKK